MQGTVPADVLWHINLKIATTQYTFNTKFHLVNGTEAANLVIANRLGARLRKLMPADAEIVYAALSMDGPPRDSLFLPSACGIGEYATSAGPPPVPAQYDYSKVVIEVRQESNGGGNVTRKYGPLPDSIVTDGHAIPAIINVVGMPGAPAAAPGAADWQTEFTNFMQDVCLNTKHVKSNHAPGGDFLYFPWKNLYSLRIGDKKGGRLLYA